MILGSLECNVPPCMRLALDITPNNCLAWPLWCNKFHNRHREFGTNQARSKSYRELFCFCLQPTMILSKSRRKTHMYIHPLGIYTNSYAIRKKIKYVCIWFALKWLGFCLNVVLVFGQSSWLIFSQGRCHQNQSKVTERAHCYSTVWLCSIM